MTIPDQMDAVQDAVAANTEDALAAHQAAQDRQARIDESMRPFDPDVVRLCHGCDEPVDQARLKVMPMSRFCTACGTLIEKKYREDARWAV